MGQSLRIYKLVLWYETNKCIVEPNGGDADEGKVKGLDVAESFSQCKVDHSHNQPNDCKYVGHERKNGEKEIKLRTDIEHRRDTKAVVGRREIFHSRLSLLSSSFLLASVEISLNPAT